MLKRFFALVLAFCLVTSNASVPVYAVTLLESERNDAYTTLAAGDEAEPTPFVIGDNTVDAPKTGYFFVYTAEQAGTATITSEGLDWRGTAYINGETGGTSVHNPKYDGNTLTRELAAGDKLVFKIVPYSGWSTVARSITVTFGFTPAGEEPVDPPATECDHAWVDADCDTPKTCSKCGATEGEALGHNWNAATCTTPKTCSVCNATEGEAAGHNYVNGACTVCGDIVTPAEPTDPEESEPEEDEPTETMAAKIGNTKYETLQEAIAAAKDGDVIVLLTDVNGTEEDYVQLDEQYKTWLKVENKSITIDLNGKTIYADATMMGKGDPHTRTEDGYGVMIDWTGEKLAGMLVGVFATCNNGHLTLKDSSPEQTGTVSALAYDAATEKCGIVYALLVNYDMGCSITVESGNYKLDIARDCLVYSGCSHNEGEGVVINGGTFQLGNVGQGRNQSPWIFNVLGRNEGHVHINGGSFNSDVRNQYWIFESQMSGDKALVYDEETGMYNTVDAKYTVNMQHKSGNWYTYEKGYVTLEEAVAAARSNVENATAANQSLKITMLADDAGAGVNVDFDLTIDLGGHTFTVTEGVDGGTNGFVIVKGGSMILSNGTVKADAENVDVLIWNDGDIRLRSVILDGTGLASTADAKVIRGKGSKSEMGSTKIIEPGSEPVA